MSDKRRGPGADAGASDPALVEDLQALLARLEAGQESLDADVRALVKRHGAATYVDLLHLLSHLRFPPDEARRHWKRIVRHRRTMGERLRGSVDLRVAMLSYFLDINRRLKNPKIIEMKLFELERSIAYLDGLTGLYNYRLFREHLEREVCFSEREGQPLSLALIDIDDFKCYNDDHGHEAGNQALIRVAGILSGTLRKTDVAARYGGEEFALILRATTKSDARLVAERARVTVERERIGRLTLSVGVATFPADAEDAAALVRHADRAMYSAKTGGKNEVVLYGQSRRSHGRVALQIQGTFRALSERTHELTTVNLSEAGLLFRTEYQLRAGSVVELTLQAEPDGPLNLSGRVVSVENGGDGTYRTAVRITEARPADRTRLSRMVRTASTGFPVAEQLTPDTPPVLVSSLPGRDRD